MDLNINLNVSKCSCKFCAVDNTEYSSMLDKLVFIEFLCYFAYQDDETTLLPIEKSKTAKTSVMSNFRNYGYTFDYDGRYIYYKYCIYRLEALLSEGTYLIKDQIFYYNDKIYLGLDNVTSLDNISTSNTTVISNWYELKNYTGQYINYFYTTEFFTYCKLNKCVVNYQKQTLFNKIKSCKNVCVEDNQKELRNFLFVTVYVLDYLICAGNYEEAQRILESISTCNGLCEDDAFINTNNYNCNCNNG